MAYISYIPKDRADSKLKALYDAYGSPEGDLDNILKIHSHNPRSMQTHYDFYKCLMYGKSELSRVQREMIAVVVSALNRCHY
jgi:alkylhydroperoxidase family enzyme